MNLIAIFVPPLALAACVLAGVLGYLIDKSADAAERK
jgi:hypothetical protein